MQFLVIGMGRFGRALAEALARAGHTVVVVDRSEEAMEGLEDLVTQALIMDATNERALSSLDLPGFDAVVVATSGNIEDSVLITMLAKGLGAKRLIAKASSELQARILLKLGVDEVVFPEREIGKKLAQRLVSPGLNELLELSEEHSLVEIRAPKAFAGKSIRETEARRKYGVHILAIKRRLPTPNPDGKMGYVEKTIVAPGPDEEIMEGDTLVILGRDEDINRVRALSK